MTLVQPAFEVIAEERGQVLSRAHAFDQLHRLPDPARAEVDAHQFARRLFGMGQIAVAQNRGCYGMRQRRRHHEAAIVFLLAHDVLGVEDRRHLLRIDRPWRRLGDQILDIAIGAEIEPARTSLAAAHEIEPARNQPAFPGIQPIARKVDMLGEQPLQRGRRELSEPLKRGAL